MAVAENHEIKILKEVHHPTSSWYLRDDGIVQILTPDEVFFTLNDAKEFLKVMEEFSGGIPHPVLINPGRHMSVDNDARAFMATEEAMKNIIALAVVESNMAMRVTSNLFMTVDKPPKPVKLFDNTREAVDWLKSQQQPQQTEQVEPPLTPKTTEEVTILSEIHHPLFDMVKRSDGIVIIETVDVAWFTINEARETMDAFKEITAGEPHLFLYIPGAHMAIDKDARTYYATVEGLKDVIAMAVILRNMAQRITSNLYMVIDKPVKPVKFFENTEDAIAWLNTHKPVHAHIPATSEEDEEVLKGSEVVREVHFPLFSLVQRSDGVVLATTADDLFLTIKDARAFVKAVRAFTRGDPHLLLIIPGRHATIDKEFRSYLASEEALQYSIAVAFVLRSTAQRTIANTFLAVDKPIKPVRFFDNTTEAIEWLKSLEEESEPDVNVDTLPALSEQGITIVKEIHRPLFDLYLRNDGIVVLSTVDHAFFTMKHAQDFIDAQRDITDGKPHLLLGIPGRHVSIDSEFRAFMATEEALQYSIAEAYVLRNMTQRGIAKLFLAIDKPIKPVQFFDGTEEAIRWLKTQLK